MAIKLSLGKLTLDGPFAPFIAEQVAVNGLILLPISLAHVARVAVLPLHHRDPFDRLLVAQALEDDLELVSNEVYIRGTAGVVTAGVAAHG
jgi:PIN domain nuclease of toxin-antitoxin system